MLNAAGMDTRKSHHSAALLCHRASAATDLATATQAPSSIPLKSTSLQSVTTFEVDKKGAGFGDGLMSLSGMLGSAVQSLEML